MWWLCLCLVFVPASAQNVSAACQKELDAYCNADVQCVEANVAKNYSLPLVARFDRSATSIVKRWRCYSPSSLSPDRSRYAHGTAYCSETALPELVAVCHGSGGSIIEGNYSLVFTADEIAQCGYIRTPQPAVLANGTVVLFAQCRIADGGAYVAPSALGDDFRRTRMVAKWSDDAGSTWSPMRWMSELSTGVGAALFDRVRGVLVFQYQTMPFPDPYRNNTLWQKTSLDGGATWSGAVDLTPQIACR